MASRAHGSSSSSGSSAGAPPSASAEERAPGPAGTQQVLAGGTQLKELLFLLDDHCSLTRDLFIAEKRLRRGATLVAADDKRRSPAWRCRARQRWPSEVRAYIQASIDSDAYIILAFEVERPQFPWLVVSNCPCCILLATLLGAFALIGVGISSATDTPGLNTDMNDFMEADGEAALRSKAFAQAVADKAAAAGGRRLQDFPELRRMIHLTYVPAEGQNLLTVGALAEIRRMEDKVRALPGLLSMCEIADPYYKKWCDRGASLANFVFPRLTPGESSSAFEFDGTGRRHLPLHIATDWARDAGITHCLLPKAVGDPSALAMEMPACRDIAADCAAQREAGQCAAFAEHEAYMQDFCAATCGYCDPAPATPPSGGTVEALRSYFVVIADCCSDRWTALMEDVATLLEGRASLPEELPGMARTQTISPRFRILYGGSRVKGWEALRAITQDMNMAAGSCLFVLFYATVHTRSPLLAAIGLFLVLLSLPMALAIFCLVTGSLKLNMMVCLSVFIVVGIGSDMIFVYTDFWKQSATSSLTMNDRIKHTYMQAASSTAATTFTTAMSFMANLASALRPLREFGFIMGTCVTCAWLMIFLAYPAVLVIVERLSTRLQGCLRRFIARTSVAESEHPDADAGGGLRGSTRRASVYGSMLLADMADPQKAGVAALHASFLGSKLASCVSFFRITLCVLFLFFTIGVATKAAQDAEKDTNVPQIFREDHNQFLLAAYEDMFDAINPLENAYTTSKFECKDLFQSCSLHSCRALGRRVGSSSSCVCMQQGVATSPCYQNEVDLRIVGRKGLSPEQVTQESVAEMLAGHIPEVTSVYMTGGSASLSFLNTTHWESGREYLASIVAVPKVTVFSSGSGGYLSCRMKTVCYCDVERCEGFVQNAGLGELALQANASGGGGAARSVEWPEGEVQPGVRRLAPRQPEARPPPGPPPPPPPGRGLAASGLVAKPSVTQQNQIYVDLVLGIKVTGEIQMFGQEREQNYYEFDPAFVFEDPWVQRMTLELCYDIPEGLQITRVVCWLGGFVEYWLGRGEEWPLRPEQWDVHSEVLSYVTSHSVWIKDSSGVSVGETADKFTWFSADGKLQAMYFQFNLDMTKYVSSTVALESMERLDAFVASFNGRLQSRTQASWKIWHQCAVWVRAEANKVILDSTLMTLTISMGCVLLGALIFTRSLHLALIVMMVVVCIIFCLTFFMVSIMGWAIGAVEVLCLIIFLGFAVDYCLHIAHKYHSCHITAFEEDPVQQEESERSQEADEAVNSASSIMRRVSVAALGTDLSNPPAIKDLMSAVNKRQSRMTVVCSDRPVLTPLQHFTLRRKNCKAEREQRTRFALERMGASIVGSALTTIGCAAFLLPCKIAVFMKIGAVVCAVSFFALLYALLALPAVLMLIGPCGHDFTSMLQLVSGLGSYMRPSEHIDLEEEEFPLRPLSSMDNEGYGDESKDLRRRNSAGNRHHYFVLNMPTCGMAQVGPRKRASKAEVRVLG